MHLLKNIIYEKCGFMICVTRMSSTRQKKYNSEKQKTQATKMDLIAWVFRFCIFNYSKRSWIL